MKWLRYALVVVPIAFALEFIPALKNRDSPGIAARAT